MIFTQEDTEIEDNDVDDDGNDVDEDDGNDDDHNNEYNDIVISSYPGKIRIVFISTCNFYSY